MEQQNITMEQKYNAICEAAIVKTYSKTRKFADTGIIPITNMDFDNPDHLFCLAIARALSGMIGAQVAIKCSRWRRWKENRRIKVKGSKLAKYQPHYDEAALDPDVLLAEMYDWAMELCGEWFAFADIYWEFYE